MVSKSTLVRPQVGHETRFIPDGLIPIDFNISLAKNTSFTGFPVKETLMVSPIPASKSPPIPIADFSFPLFTVPDSVIPI
ncbi:hypothetical protein SDC9_199105 [bioreactor metagenome]|uniref:Uncharacterized protein n=1 Tax=bioreactor metagenome TaxID=1076179 RepID=A0A645ILW7_9ZZZZ